MRLATMVRVLFVIYCFEAGFLLVVLPWHPMWDRTVMQVPFAALRNLCFHPVLRGGVTGFGLIHLVWGLHDLRALFTARGPDAGAGV
jgi:hypothetical protein